MRLLTNSGESFHLSDTAAPASVLCEDVRFELSTWDLSRVIEIVNRVSGAPCGRVNTVGRGGTAPYLVFALWVVLNRGGFCLGFLVIKDYIKVISSQK
jgi:hypothetical protein